MIEQLKLLIPPWRFVEPEASEDTLRVGDRTVTVRFVRSGAARRYILRITRAGSARVTVPRRGSLKEARAFLDRQSGWIEKQLRQRERSSSPPLDWGQGTEILFRGEKTRLEVAPDGRRVRFSEHSFFLPQTSRNLRPLLERKLRRLAEVELVPRTLELAALHRETIRRITVRDQRSRWGSCSSQKTISLNWRLIQAPPHVRDYIILHELMHLREMNHSARFWREVAAVCPDYPRAESWLKAHGGLLS